MFLVVPPPFKLFVLGLFLSMVGTRALPQFVIIVKLIQTIGLQPVLMLLLKIWIKVQLICFMILVVLCLLLVRALVLFG